MRNMILGILLLLRLQIYNTNIFIILPIHMWSVYSLTYCDQVKFVWSWFLIPFVWLGHHNRSEAHLTIWQSDKQQFFIYKAFNQHILWKCVLLRLFIHRYLNIKHRKWHSLCWKIVKEINSRTKKSCSHNGE